MHESSVMFIIAVSPDKNSNRRVNLSIVVWAPIPNA